jgi:hypothetical protein
LAKESRPQAEIVDEGILGHIKPDVMNNIGHNVTASARLVVETVEIHFDDIFDIFDGLRMNVGRAEQENGRQGERQQDGGKQRLLPQSDGQRQLAGTAPLLGVVVVNQNHFFSRPLSSKLCHLIQT